MSKLIKSTTNTSVNIVISYDDVKFKYAIRVFEVYGYTAMFEVPFEIDFRGQPCGS